MSCPKKPQKYPPRLQVLKTSTVTELMAQQLRRDVDDGLIKGCFAAFTNTPQALFVEISEVVSLINLDAGQLPRRATPPFSVLLRARPPSPPRRRPDEATRAPELQTAP